MPGFWGRARAGGLGWEPEATAHFPQSRPGDGGRCLEGSPSSPSGGRGRPYCMERGSPGESPLGAFRMCGPGARGARGCGRVFVLAGVRAGGRGGEKHAGWRISRPTRRSLCPGTRLLDFPWADRCQHFGANPRVADW